MPPDEYQEAANNSIYTNLVANLAVNTARWTDCLLNGEAAAETAVPDAWLEKMKNLVFLYNEEKQYHEEFEGFDDQLVNGKTHLQVLSGGPGYICTFFLVKIYKVHLQFQET